MSDSTGTSSRSTSTPQARARIVTLRATSVPDRSSRGSGSVKPFSFASAITSENFIPGLYVLKRYESVPEKMPSIVFTLSPVPTRSVRSTLRIGSPAPTVVSSPHIAPVSAIAFLHARKRLRSPEPAFLFGATWTPFSSHFG